VHISAIQHHLTGAHAPSFHPSNGLLDRSRKCPLLPRAEHTLSLPPRTQHRDNIHRRRNSVSEYLSLLRDGASRANPSNTRDLHPAAHEVSVTLVALEDEHVVRICTAELVRGGEGTNEARAEEVRNMKNAMRMRCDEGAKGQEREVEWAWAAGPRSDVVSGRRKQSRS